jgi:hypothetical protein
MGKSVRRLWGVRKYALNLASEQRPTKLTRQDRGGACIVCLTFDTTGQKTLEPEGLCNAPRDANEHVHD